jgi:hypothetical protein
MSVTLNLARSTLRNLSCLSPKIDVACVCAHQVASCRRVTAYELNVWSRERGEHLYDIMGPKLTLLDVAWHPSGPLLVTATTSPGLVVWQVGDSYPGVLSRVSCAGLRRVTCWLGGLGR